MSPLPSIVMPDTADIQGQGQELVLAGKAVVIKTPAELDAAGALLKRIALYKKVVQDRFAVVKKTAHQLHKMITGIESDLLAPANEADAAVRAAVSRYSVEEQRRRREEEARLAAEVRRQQEEAALAQAQSMSDAGDKEGAEQVVEAAAHAPAPVVMLPPPRVEGISTRRRWTFRVVDETKVSRQFLAVDEQKIRRTVAAMGPDASAIVGGIEVYDEPVVAVRAS